MVMFTPSDPSRKKEGWRVTVMLFARPAKGVDCPIFFVTNSGRTTYMMSLMFLSYGLVFRVGI